MIKIKTNPYNRNYTYEKIKSKLTQKADINADNFSSAGKETITNWAFPSQKTDDLSLGTSGSIYAAPANGWFYLSKVADNANQFIFMSSAKLTNEMWSAERGLWCKTFLPVQKGDNVTIDYTATGEIKAFKFIYAEGSK